MAAAARGRHRPDQQPVLGVADFEFEQTPPADPEDLRRADDVSFAGVRVLPDGQVLEDDDEHRAGPPPIPQPAWEKPPPAGPTALVGIDALFADIDRELDLGSVDLPVPVRDGFVCRYERLLDSRRIEPWRALAYDPTTLEGVDKTRLASLGLSALHLGFVVDGQLVPGDDGQPLTFRSPHVQTKLGVTPGNTDEEQRDAAAEAVLRYYALYVHASFAWQTLLALSGFADVIAPQERPSPT